MRRGTVAGFLRVDTPEESTPYPQAGDDSSLPGFQELYWRIASVFFASSRRANPNARHLLITNARPPTVGGYDLAAFFRRLGVDLVDLPFTYRPPPGYWSSWVNQFYVLDVITYLSNDGADFPAVILDLDCIFVRPGDRLFDVVVQSGIANYVVEEIDSDPSYVSNGLTTPQLQKIADEIAGRPLPRIRYCGGELFGATREVAEAIADAAQGLWQECLHRHERGMPKLNTEEHFFSTLYAILGLPTGTANGVIRRLWTRRSYRNTTQRDIHLTVWHVPAEKKYGLSRLYPEAVDPGSPFWKLPADSELTRYLGSRLGIPRPTLEKRARDLLVAARSRVS